MNDQIRATRLREALETLLDVGSGCDCRHHPDCCCEYCDARSAAKSVIEDDDRILEGAKREARNHLR